MLMTARMPNPAFAVDGAMDGLNALSKAISHARVPLSRELVHLRASQINGCSVCVDMHAKAARKSGESEERVFAVAAWRETPYFSDAERAALALTEALTRLADQAEQVPDAIWDDLREVIEPIFVKHGVDAAFTGHEHFYERIVPQKGIYYFITGAGAKLRKGDVKEGSPLTAKAFDADLSFMLVEISKDLMHFQVISRTGATVDSGALVRPNR